MGQIGNFSGVATSFFALVLRLFLVSAPKFCILEDIKKKVPRMSQEGEFILRFVPELGDVVQVE